MAALLTSQDKGERSARLMVAACQARTNVQQKALLLDQALVICADLLAGLPLSCRQVVPPIQQAKAAVNVLHQSSTTVPPTRLSVNPPLAATRCLSPYV